MIAPKRIDITPKQLEELLARAKESLPKEDYEIIKGMADTISFLSNAVNSKSASIQRLLAMLFGTITEKTAKVLREKKAIESDKKKKCRGHGKNGAVSYSGAEKIKIPHESLKPKDRCPACKKGKVYDMPSPSLIVRISAQAPLSAKVYELQKLRCNLCGQVFTAAVPEGLGDEKYDSASGAMIALLKYGSGLPFNRLDNLQESLGIPLPAST